MGWLVRFEKAFCFPFPIGRVERAMTGKHYLGRGKGGGPTAMICIILPTTTTTATAARFYLQFSLTFVCYLCFSLLAVKLLCGVLPVHPEAKPSHPEQRVPEHSCCCD